MKTRKLLATLPLIAVLGACNDDLEIANGEVTIKVNDNGITSPQWLVEVVDSVAHRYNPSPNTGEYPYPQVYIKEYGSEDYILICDYASSDLYKGNLIFTPQGEPVLPEEGNNDSLYERIRTQGESQKVWSPF